MRAIRVLVFLSVVLSPFAPLAANGDSSPAQTITVTGNASVSYAPDIALISLGVRAQSASASAASKSVNQRVSTVIAALHRVGISDADITTSNYTIEFQPSQIPESFQPTSGDPPAIMRRPLPGPVYVADESIDVRAPIAKAGTVLDAAIAAGANQSYGLAFDTSQRTALYREALSRAVEDARAQAEVLARAAGVALGAIQTISVGGGQAGPVAMMRLAAPNAQVLGGTGTVDASVEVVYLIGQK